MPLGKAISLQRNSGRKKNMEDNEEIEVTQKKSQVAHEDFIRTWNGSTSVKEAAEAMGLKPASARSRANSMRKYGINLVKHKRPPPPGRTALDADPEKLARLQAIANDTYVAPAAEADGLVPPPAPPPAITI